MEVVIKTLTPEGLLQYINAEAFDKLPVVPISRHRALSHIHNPRVDTEDTIMILAYINDVLVGYLGVFADRLHFETEHSKAGWLSCMWVNPTTRGKGIAKKLLQRALKDWDQKILVTEFTVAAKGLYDRSQAFQDLAIRKGVRVFFRSNAHEILPVKHKVFQQLKPLLHISDQVANLVFDALQSSPKNRSGFKYKICNAIDAQIISFIQDYLKTQLIRRNESELKWVLKHPWVISGVDKDNYKERYEFSAIDRSFDFFPIKIFNQESKMIAFLLFSKRNQHLKIPYAYFQQKDAKQIGQLIAYFSKKWNVNMLSCFDSNLSETMKDSSFPGIYKRDISRHYIVSKVFEENIKPLTIRLQDGDADCVFT